METNTTKKILYTITVGVKYNNNSERNFLMRITPDIESAKRLLRKVYEDAQNNKNTICGKLSNPKWLNESHTMLKITRICYIHYTRREATEIYCINVELKDNIYSEKELV